MERSIEKKERIIEVYIKREREVEWKKEPYGERQI